MGDTHAAGRYPHLRTVLSTEFVDVGDDEIEDLFDAAGLSAADVEFNLGRALTSVGRAVVSAAPSVLPVVGTVAGTAFGGPLGGALGGSLGSLAGRAVGAASAPGVRRPPAAPGASVPARRGAGAGRGSPAAGSLLQLLQRPEILQSLTSMAIGPAGRSRVPVGNTSVPLGAITNLLGRLAAQASEEYHEMLVAGADSDVAYLMDASGEFVVDPASPEARAEHLLALFGEQARAEAAEALQHTGRATELDRFDRLLDESWSEDDEDDEDDEEEWFDDEIDDGFEFDDEIDDDLEFDDDFEFDGEEAYA